MLGLRLPVRDAGRDLTRFGFGELSPGIEMPRGVQGHPADGGQWDGRAPHRRAVRPGPPVRQRPPGRETSTRRSRTAGAACGAHRGRLDLAGRRVHAGGPDDGRAGGLAADRGDRADDAGERGRRGHRRPRRDRGLPRRRQDGHRAGDGAGGVTAYFVGVVPADDPRLVVGVFVRNPTSSIWGGSVAAPVFSEVAGFSAGRAGRGPVRDRRDPVPRHLVARTTW